MAHDPIEQLHRVLVREARAFTTGDYATLADIAKEKERLLADLQQTTPSQDSLRDLHQNMERNRRLAEAALKGVHSARTRISALLQVQSGLTTYDPDGTVATRDTGKTTVERKA